MNRTYITASTLLLLAIVCILIKWPAAKENEIYKPKEHGGILESKVDNTANTPQELQTPVAKVIYKEHLPKFELIQAFHANGLIDPEKMKRLQSMKAIPWQVYIDQNDRIVKMQMRDVAFPTMNYDAESVAKIEQQGFRIVKVGIDSFKLSQKSSLQSLYTFLDGIQVNLLEKATHAHDNLNNFELEIYPVMVEMTEDSSNRAGVANMQYFRNQQIPMLLVKENTGYLTAKDLSTGGAEWINAYQRYGENQVVGFSLTLYPFPYNEETTKLYANCPNLNSVGAFAEYPSPTVDAWKREHTKKN